MQSTTTTNTGNFFDWFSQLGGELSRFDYEALNKPVSKVSPQESSLKGKAKEIKEKYNHNFQFRNDRY